MHWALGPLPLALALSPGGPLTLSLTLLGYIAAWPLIQASYAFLALWNLLAAPLVPNPSNWLKLKQNP